MPRRPLNARIEILQPLTSSVLRYGSGVYEHSRHLHSGMTWREARALPMTNTDWWSLLSRRLVRFVLPDGSELPFGSGPRLPRTMRTSTSVRALRVVLDDSFPEEFTFGIEIECVMPRTMSHQSLAALLTESQVPAHVEGYSASSRRAPAEWEITTDGSIRCHGGRYSFGAETKSPILRGIEGMRQTRKVCETMEAARVKVNKSCGLHVHVGARNRSLEWFKRVLQIYAEYEPQIDAILSPSRRANYNGYCKSITHCALTSAVANATTLDELRVAYGRDRFRKVNLEAFWRHGTIEFRQHQGTVNPEKVEHWVRLLLAICARATVETEITQSHPRTLEGLFSLINVTDQTRRYHIGRRDYFSRREMARLAA